jgi:hypothetical protein
MCKVVEIRHVEDCFDGDFIKEFELDTAVDEPTMRRMALDARLQYYPDFPRPYYRIDKNGFYTIQGVIGNTTFRVTFSRSAPEDTADALKYQIEEGECYGCETGPVL